MPRLFTELDHLGLLRQAGGGRDPDPAHVAILAELAGAGGISVPCTRGGSGVQERDLRVMREVVHTVFALCIPPQDDLVKLALTLRPDLVTLIPEPREPYEPERGLDIEDRRSELAGCIDALKGGKIPVVLLVDPSPLQIKAAQRTGAGGVRLHTGRFCWAADQGARAAEYEALLNAAKVALRLGLPVHAGGGIGYQTVGAIAQIPEIDTVVVGHSFLARAMLVGVAEAVGELLRLMREGAAR
ncbi:MAG: pyridoxine 5'-phosphate synthase [candidate division NC10 bacterium]|nr:pyridoxine 5'-phosphate synthase [candidate division NC10 bacterium]